MDKCCVHCPIKQFLWLLLLLLAWFERSSDCTGPRCALLIRQTMLGPHSPNAALPRVQTPANANFLSQARSGVTLRKCPARAIDGSVSQQHPSPPWSFSALCPGRRRLGGAFLYQKRDNRPLFSHRHLPATTLSACAPHSVRYECVHDVHKGSPLDGPPELARGFCVRPT